MGDDGALYPGLDETKVANYKDLVDVSDIIIPNQTEAKFLDLDIDGITKNGKKIIITSADKDGKPAVLYYDGKENAIFYDKKDIKVGGSGDLFDGLFIGYLLKDFDIPKAIEKTCQDIIKIMVANEKKNPGAIEINIEKYLTLIGA